ncbi:MAG TPA: response regulator [Flavisolibacter sp.]|nr:response regulator [Flavisolibacter sp.]
MSKEPHRHTILYAEDDIDDLFLVQQAFEQYGGSVVLVHASNGFEVLKELQRLINGKTTPCLIILDINMPGMDGKEALIRLKQSDKFRNIPVTLFTTSSSDADRAFANKWGAGFITKPLVFSELEELARSFLRLCNEPELPVKSS